MQNQCRTFTANRKMIDSKNQILSKLKVSTIVQANMMVNDNGTVTRIFRRIFRGKIIKNRTIRRTARATLTNHVRQLKARIIMIVTEETQDTTKDKRTTPTKKYQDPKVLLIRDLKVEVEVERIMDRQEITSRETIQEIKDTQEKSRNEEQQRQ